MADELRPHWISKTARLADDLERPDPQAMTHAATIRRANADDQFLSNCSTPMTATA